MPRVVVTAFGPDRPGIVATVTGVLVRNGANLADTAMTNLAGQFAMVLVVDVSAEGTADALERTLAEETAAIGLTVAVRPLTEEGDDPPVVGDVGTSWAVSVHGADQPGIVHRVTTALAERHANVVDLTTRTIGTPEEPVYVMLLDIVLPEGADVSALQEELAGLADDLRVEIRVRADDADIL
ncbi:MAG: ACT domain-containing protein [Acidimicrobiales bacterium]